MRTIGQLIRNSRNQKNYSFKKLESITKIKREFLSAIEEEDWSKLPEYPVVTGFVRTIAKTLDLSPDQALATLRRDYPPKTLAINPKPDVEKGFRWNPKFTYILTILFLSLIVVGYLVFQYANFIKPPFLEVDEPVDQAVVRTSNLMVSGRVDPDSSVYVNNQPAFVDEDGVFTTSIEISENTKDVEIKAKSRSGKESVIHRIIRPELDEN